MVVEEFTLCILYSLCLYVKINDTYWQQQQWLLLVCESEHPDSLLLKMMK